MEEVLFKGKRKDNGEWVYGDLMKYESGAMSILYKKFSAYGFEATEICRRVEVIPETVGQYVRRVDKNGQKIFEGDRVRVFSSTYDGEVMSYECTINNMTDFAAMWHIEHEPLEVIGNIHDNPEEI